MLAARAPSAHQMRCANLHLNLFTLLNARSSIHHSKFRTAKLSSFSQKNLDGDTKEPSSITPSTLIITL